MKVLFTGKHVFEIAKFSIKKVGELNGAGAIRDGDAYFRICFFSSKKPRICWDVMKLFSLSFKASYMILQKEAENPYFTNQKILTARTSFLLHFSNINC